METDSTVTAVSVLDAAHGGAGRRDSPGECFRVRRVCSTLLRLYPVRSALFLFTTRPLCLPNDPFDVIFTFAVRHIVRFRPEISPHSSDRTNAYCVLYLLGQFFHSYFVYRVDVGCPHLAEHTCLLLPESKR